MVRTFAGRIRGGKVELNDKAGFRLAVEALEGAQITLRLEKFRENRSLNQNSYYWGCVLPLLGEHCGYDPDDKHEMEELHQALKWRFLRKTDDYGIETSRSSAGLTTAEFSAFTEQVRRLAAELGVVIPDPGVAA